MTTPKKCATCGAVPVIITPFFNDVYRVVCQNCERETKNWYGNKQDAIERWNNKDNTIYPHGQKSTPEHYTGGIEPLEYIESWGMDFAEGNVVKYITRWRRKSAVLSSQKDDLLKAQAYLGHLIERTDHAHTNRGGETE